MNHVVLISTGGTIASRIDRERGYVTPQTGGGELLDLVRQELPNLLVEVDEFCNVASFNLDLEDAFGLARRIERHLTSLDVVGVVVTHGTDTMEESAFLADLVVASDKPIVFTGAQRHADERDSDGPRNLVGAIRLAASGLQGLGAVIFFDQEFHAARDVTKRHAYRVGTFTSMEHGKLGEIDGEAIVLHRRPLLRATVAAPRIETAVDLIKLAMGADSRLLRGSLASGARGVVIEAFGRGNAPLAVLAGVREVIAAGLPVVITSRCPEGRVQPIYGHGGGRDLADAGAIFAGDLTALKARILLALLLGADLALPAIAVHFAVLAG